MVDFIHYLPRTQLLRFSVCFSTHETFHEKGSTSQGKDLLTRRAIRPVNRRARFRSDAKKTDKGVSIHFP